MKVVLFFFLFIVYNLKTFAGSAIVRVEPQQPAAGEMFSVIFEIETNNSDEPFIAFDPGQLSVQGKGETGYSTRTTIINGKITTERKMSVAYTMSADKAGINTIKDISITVGDDKIEVKDLKVQILSESSKTRDIFIEAELSKDVAYVGEGITVNYYLYSKFPVTTIDFDNFPKLNDFVKRFYNPTGMKETVKHNGEIMSRSLRYSARIFPTKAGELEVDPLRLRVGYFEDSNNYNPYSVLGVGFGKTKTKTFSSQKLKLIVKDLPPNPPSGFTGLVGDHSFKMLAPRNKYLVNEAIELKLEVEGEGLLEKYDGPQIYEHDELESFDVKAELKDDSQGRARKIYDFTYLARNNLTIPARSMELYYLNPTNDQYEKVVIEVPELVASGGTAKASSDPSTAPQEDASGTAKEEAPKNILAKKIIPPQEVRELSPIFQIELIKKNIYQKLNIALLIIILLFSLEELRKYFTKDSREIDKLKSLLKKMKKGEVSYANLYLFLDLCVRGEGPLTERLEASSMDADSKRYFLSLLDNVGNSEYKSKKALGIKLEENRIKSLLLLSEKRHENTNPYL
jgi:hypothetical protein